MWSPSFIDYSCVFTHSVPVAFTIGGCIPTGELLRELGAKITDSMIRDNSFEILRYLTSKITFGSGSIQFNIAKTFFISLLTRYVSIGISRQNWGLESIGFTNILRSLVRGIQEHSAELLETIKDKFAPIAAVLGNFMVNADEDMGPSAYVGAVYRFFGHINGNTITG